MLPAASNFGEPSPSESVARERERADKRVELLCCCAHREEELKSGWLMQCGISWRGLVFSTPLIIPHMLIYGVNTAETQP